MQVQELNFLVSGLNFLNVIIQLKLERFELHVWGVVLQYLSLVRQIRSQFQAAHSALDDVRIRQFQRFLDSWKLIIQQVLVSESYEFVRLELERDKIV